MKETRKLKKRNLHDEEIDGKRVGKMQKKNKKEKVSNVDIIEHPQATPQAISSEKPKEKKVEPTKKMQNSKKIVKDVNSSPVDGKLSGNLKKRKEKPGNAGISKFYQTNLEALTSEKPEEKKVEPKKKMMQKSEKIADGINISPVDGKLSAKTKKRKEKGGNVDISKDSQPKLEAISNEKVKEKKGKIKKTKNKRKAEEISSNSVDVDDEEDQLIRKGKSKKSNKKKKMKLTPTKETETSSDKMTEIEDEEEHVYQISSGDEDCAKGMKKWVTNYYESRPGLDELQKRIDDYMTAHENRLEQERQNKEAKAAEGGWTVVVHHKGRKKTTDSESGIAVGSVSQVALEDKLAKKKLSEPVAQGFYRFQRREAQRNEILALQSKFEQDKKRIQQLRAARKFKPQ